MLSTVGKYESTAYIANDRVRVFTMTARSERAVPITTALTPRSRRCLSKTLMSRPQSLERIASAPEFFIFVTIEERSLDMRGMVVLAHYLGVGDLTSNLFS